jgi:hypothetical protein
VKKYLAAQSAGMPRSWDRQSLGLLHTRYGTSCCYEFSLVQTLRDVAELAKFMSRSMHLGYQRVTKHFLAQHSLPSESSPQLELLGTLWSQQHARHLDSVAVCFCRHTAHLHECCSQVKCMRDTDCLAEPAQLLMQGTTAESAMKPKHTLHVHRRPWHGSQR